MSSCMLLLSADKTLVRCMQQDSCRAQAYVCCDAVQRSCCVANGYYCVESWMKSGDSLSKSGQTKDVDPSLTLVAPAFQTDTSSLTGT